MPDLLDNLPTKKPQGLKIVSLQAENVKRLVAIRIDPKGNMVQITGRNRSGKSSTLDSIWWALAGAGNVQSAPIRQGQNKAIIKLDLGEVVVTRTFSRQEDGTARTTVMVESAEGARFPTPQRMLDSLLGSLTFDPLAFARMKPAEQFDALKAFVPGIDFEEIAGLDRADFAKRADVNRRAKELRAQAGAIQIPETVPAEKVDESALTDELAAVGEHNAQIELRASRRQATREAAERARAEAQDLREKAANARRLAAEYDQEAERKDSTAAEKENALAMADPLPLHKDPSEVRARLDAARRTNALVDQAARRTKLIVDADAAEAESKALTTKMETREADKREKIAAAKMPVEGLGFGEAAITLNGLPFDQASDAEQLRVSCAIAMSANPKLRVIRVRDGSLLDEDAMALLAKMADDHDMQVWIEAVDSSGRVGIVLEDGRVASTPESRATAQVTE